MSKSKYKSEKKQELESSSSLDVMMSKLSLMELLQESVKNFAVEMGMCLIKELLLRDVEELCGASYSRGGEVYRHGHQRGVVMMGGAKHSLEKPRVRSKSGKEVSLPHYEGLQGKELLSLECMKRMLLGVSTRNYEEVIDASTESFGVSKGSVSRQFINGSKQALAALNERDFSDKRIPVVMIDGIEFAGEVIVAALGIDEQGHKHILGIRQGATENNEVVSSLLSELTSERGLSTASPTLFVIDGSKALLSSIKKFWGSNAFIQRCILHKKRNILGHLNEMHKDTAQKLFNDVFSQSTAEQAHKKLKVLLKYLKKVAPSAAKSLEEAWDYLLTVHELDIPESIRRTLLTTNPIESAFSVARQSARNVKRWRNGDMRLRWAAAGLAHAEKKFRRIKGYKDMQSLIRKIDDAAIIRKGIDPSVIAA